MNMRETAKTILPVIEKSAPLLASLIGGPTGGAVAWVVSMLAQQFDAEHGDLPGLINNMQSDPDMETKLKDLQDKHLTTISDLMQSFKSPSRIEVRFIASWDREKAVNE
jgi:hypothetical protein